MGIADGPGLPLALRAESASPAEVKLVEATLEERIVPEVPERLIGDKAYDSDQLDQALMEHYGTEMIAPNRDDASTVGLSLTTLSVAEDTNSITVEVVRTGVTNTAVSVNFATAAESATAGSDFYATNGTLTFAAGVATNSFRVRVIDDGRAENNETFSVRLSSATNCSLGAANLAVTITTNDSAYLAWSVATNSVSETNGTLTLTVIRTGTPWNPVSVDFTTTNVTALVDRDYTATNGTLTFAAGETNKTIDIELLNDDLQENTETFRVVLRNPVDANLSLGTNTVVVLDDDGSTVEFTTNAVAVSETNGLVTLTIVRTGATNTSVAVDYLTTNVTALGTSDYTGTSGTLYFAPGEATNTVTVTLADDLLYENTETFRVLLRNATNTTLTVSSNVVSITDNDASFVNLSTSAQAVNELDGSVSLSVYRTGVTNTTVSVRYMTMNISASSGSDYTATSGMLVFAAGETNKSISVAILTDDAVEAAETFRIRLTTATNTALGTVTNDTVTIYDAFGGIDTGNLVTLQSITRLEDGWLNVRVVGPNGAAVALQSSTNLFNWATIAITTITNNAFEWFEYPDNLNRYFRIVPPQ